MRFYFNAVKPCSQVPAGHKRRTRIIAALVCVLALAPTSLSALTVAIFTTHERANERIRSAVEAGVMEKFFNANHIAVNATPNKVALGDNEHYQWLRNIAFDMGADYLLWVESSHRIERERVVFESRYVFIEIARPGSLIEHHTSYHNNRQKNRESPAQLGYRLGQKIVDEILTEMTNNADYSSDGL